MLAKSWRSVIGANRSRQGRFNQTYKTGAREAGGRSRGGFIITSTEQVGKLNLAFFSNQ